MGGLSAIALHCHTKGARGMCAVPYVMTSSFGRAFNVGRVSIGGCFINSISMAPAVSSVIVSTADGGTD